MYSSDPTGGNKEAFRGCGEGAAAPQTGVCHAAVHGTSSDGNVDRSKFKDQLINKLITRLKRLDKGQVATNLSICLLAEDENPGGYSLIYVCTNNQCMYQYQGYCFSDVLIINRVSI